MSDTEFEAKLHQIVFPQIRTKAPKLIPLMVGFELLDVNTDQTRAAGVYVFRVGKKQCMIPIIFDEGHVKGLNFLYIAEDDIFIPLEDEWVEDIIQNQTFTLGKLIDRNEIKDDDNMFGNVADAFGKNASTKKMASDRFLSDKRYKQATDFMSLDNILPRLSKKATLSILKTMENDDEFGRSMLRYYPWDKFEKIANKVITPKHKNKVEDTVDTDTIAGLVSDPINQGIKYRKPKILSKKDVDTLYEDLSSADKEDLKRYGVVVRDSRKKNEVTKVYKTDAPTDWFTPDSSGVYHLLTSDNEIAKDCLISKDLVTVGDGTARGFVVIHDGKAGQYTGKSITATAISNKSCEELISKKPKISKSELKKGDKFVLANSKGEMTPILTALGPVSKNESGVKTLWVSQSYNMTSASSTSEKYDGLGGIAENDWIEMQYSEEETPFSVSYSEDFGPVSIEVVSCGSCYGRKIVIMGEGDELTPSGPQLFAGEEVRVVKVDKEPSEGKFKVKVENTIWPMLKKAGANKLTVSYANDFYKIASGIINSGSVNRKEALSHLILVHGLDKTAAMESIKAAEVARAKMEPCVSFAIKYAATYPMLDIQGTGDGNSGIQEGQTTVNPDEGGANPFLTEDINKVNEAAASGQKSVFDASVLASLFRTNNVSSELDSYLGDLTLGLDRICRVLFMIYAHEEEVKDLYGSEDTRDIQDILESVVKDLGQTLLFLKKKSKEFYSDLASEPESVYDLVR